MDRALEFRHCFWATVLSFAAACAPTPLPTSPTPPAPTDSPTPNPTATAPLAASPIPTPTNADARPAIFADDFSRDRGWELSDSPSGAVSILNQRLVIAVQGPSAVLYSLSPAPEAADFELEVTVRSEICAAGDEFGFMVRARSLQTHYRFTLSCEGSVRASRFIDGREAALAPITAAEAGFGGAPAINRLRLHALGDQFRLLVNDIEALEVTDSQLASGAVGLLVRARRSSQTTISFDDFNLYPVNED